MAQAYTGGNGDNSDKGWYATDYVIYADVLVAVNFIIDLMILRLCQPLTGLRQKGIRPYLAAAAGGLCSMVIFLPVSSFWLDLAIRLGVSLVVITIAYGRQRPRVFAKLLAVFYAVSFLVAGAVMGLWFLFPSGGYAYRNGMVYLNLKPLALIGSVAAAYLFVTVFERIFAWRKTERELYRVTVCREGRTVIFTALADTGNQLVEHFSGSPLLVVAMEKGKLLLSPREADYILRGRLDEDLPPGLRMVPYCAVGGGGLLFAFRPDSVQVEVEGRRQEVACYLALNPGPMDARDCDAILNPKVIQLLVPNHG